MKRMYPLFLFLFIVVKYSHAQNPTPNPGFEKWDDTTLVEQFMIPRDWNSLNTVVGEIGVLTCLRCDTSHSGNYAVKLVTDSIKGEPPVNGIVTTGNINISAQNVTGGIPYNLRPDSMYGWFKYFPTKGDSTDIEFGLYDNSGNTIGFASFTYGTTRPIYTRFSVPITYYSSATPDTSRWFFSSSNGHKSYVGSRLYIDDIGLVGGSAGINKPVAGNFSISIAPNPAAGFIIITNPKLVQGIISIYTETGEEVKQFQLNSEQQNLDVHGLAAGNYLYSITNNGGCITNGKIILK